MVFPVSQKIFVAVYQINDFFQNSGNQLFQKFPIGTKSTVQNTMTTNFRFAITKYVTRITGNSSIELPLFLPEWIIDRI